MAKYTVPSRDEIAEMVRSYDRRVGLRMLYQRHNIPESERHKYRKLWKAFWEVLPDGFEKKDASKKRKTTEDDGNSGTPAGEAVPEEQKSAEDVKESVA
jgi:hypothetical protein